MRRKKKSRVSGVPEVAISQDELLYSYQLFVFTIDD